MLSESFLYMPFFRLMKFSTVPHLPIFFLIMNVCWIFQHTKALSNAFSAYIKMIIFCLDMFFMLKNLDLDFFFLLTHYKFHCCNTSLFGIGKLKHRKMQQEQPQHHWCSLGLCWEGDPTIILASTHSPWPWTECSCCSRFCYIASKNAFVLADN